MDWLPVKVLGEGVIFRVMDTCITLMQFMIAFLKVPPSGQIMVLTYFSSNVILINLE